MSVHVVELKMSFVPVWIHCNGIILYWVSVILITTILESWPYNEVIFFKPTGSKQSGLNTCSFASHSAFTCPTSTPRWKRTTSCRARSARTPLPLSSTPEDPCSNLVAAFFWPCRPTPLKAYMALWLNAPRFQSTQEELACRCRTFEQLGRTSMALEELRMGWCPCFEFSMKRRGT